MVVMGDYDFQVIGPDRDDFAAWCEDNGCQPTRAAFAAYMGENHPVRY